MNIIILCLGMPFNGHTITEKSLGGSESAAYYVAKGLAQKHQVTMFTNHPDEGDWDGVRYLYAGQPTEHQPMGNRFHFYAENTPHDVLIIQRVPNAFAHNFASKVNLWWLHDLALYRTKPLVDSHLHNIDGVLTVSEYHKKQVGEVYGIPDSHIHVVNNGIDLDHFAFRHLHERRTKTLLYSSRPERGLENLIAPGGVMDQLGHDYTLHVCGYDNTTDQMRPYYESLWHRIDEMPNAVNLGPMTKGHLYEEMSLCTALVYPTTFEEVSCITAMEAMAAGLPFISSEHAALPETCRGSGSILVPIKGDYDHPQADVDGIVSAVRRIHNDNDEWSELHRAQLKASESRSWDYVVSNITTAIDAAFWRYSNTSVLRRLIDNSDYYAAQELVKRTPPVGGVFDQLKSELEECYAFTENPNAWGKHYEDYYQYEKDRGVVYGPESLSGEGRFETVSGRIHDILSSGNSVGAGNISGRVLDYGCAHGHYTINLAKRFPGCVFVGVDISRSNIDTARQWAKDEGLSNVEFHLDDTTTGLQSIVGQQFDVIIAAEVLEHVAKPEEVANELIKNLAPDGTFLATTPFGPWEAIGYKQHWPWRAHVHHFERNDLALMFDEFDCYTINTIPSRHTREGDLVGSYLVTFRNTEGVRVKGLDWLVYSRKHMQTKGRDTVALCMIARDAEHDIGRAIMSVVDHIDELIVNIDVNTRDDTRAVIENIIDTRPWIRASIEFEDSPMDSGFAQARNNTIDRASADWILWLDSDEEFVNPHRLQKYLRNNMYSGYAIQQHHFSVEPLGVLKTDMPVKLFRNHKGIRFFGEVHEHPEIELNKGVGHVKLLSDVHVMHTSYLTEEIRRARFGRNIDLMRRDRQQNPNRTLGKMLWVRDVAQMIKFEAEQTGQVSENTRQHAGAAAELWRELRNENLRMAVDSLTYYSTLAAISSPDAIDYSFAVDVSPPASVKKPEPKTFSGTFASIADAQAFRDLVEAEQAKNVRSRYA
jgi:2-polyprenyl-3-methyl-5-hydroxy-6-metoxy-1,4-benzoquinol methylase/glycosyltransferase involved in cell wall biosynthesis